jgi:hypothetical protein
MPENTDSHDGLKLHHGNTPVPDPTVLTTAALTREIAALKELVVVRLDGMDKAQSLFEVNLTRVPTDTDKQIQHLKELHDSRFEQIAKQSETRFVQLLSEAELARHSVEVRIDGMDKAIALLQRNSDQIVQQSVEDTLQKINALKGVHEEKFASIQKQFQERDVRTEQSSKDSKVAVDAALQAAKEAVGEQNKSSALAIAKSEAATTKQIDQMGQFIQSGNKATDDKIDDIKERLTRIEGKSEGSVVADATHTTSSTQVVLIVSVLIASAGLLFGIYEALVPKGQPQIIYMPAPSGTMLPSPPTVGPGK